MTKEELKLAGKWFASKGVTLFVYMSGDCALILKDDKCNKYFVEITENEVKHRAKLGARL